MALHRVAFQAGNQAGGSQEIMLVCLWLYAIWWSSQSDARGYAFLTHVLFRPAIAAFRRAARVSGWSTPWICSLITTARSNWSRASA